MGQFDGRLDVAYRMPPHPELAWKGSGYVTLGEWDHPASRSGAEPLPASARAEILSLLRQVGTTDRDEVIQEVSRYLAGRLKDRQGQ